MKKQLTTALVLCTALPAAAVAQDGEEAPEIVSFSGFVDTSVVIPVMGYDDSSDQVTFGLDQVEVDITATPAEGLTLQADLNVFPADSTPLTGDSLFEQGFIDYEAANGVFVRAGKANAPIGAEGIDPVDLYQYSQGQLFTNATPSNLTGIFAGYRSDGFSGQLFLTNDWDMPGGVVSPTPGLRAEYAFAPGHVGLSSTFGPLNGADSAAGVTGDYIMIDVDTALEFGDLTILGEFNFGTADDFTRIGALATLSYAITDWVSATVRGDMLSETIGDADAATSISATVAGLFTLTDNFGAVAEFRADIPDEGDTIGTAAFELLAWW